MGLFNPKLQETGGSAVTPKAAAQKPNIVGEVANVVKQSASIFASVGAAKQEGVNNSVVSKFNQELSRLAEGVNQGTMSEEAAATASRTKYAQFVSNNPALTAEFNKAYKGVSETTDAFSEKESEQERLTKLVNTKMANGGYLTGNENEQELQIKREAFSKSEMAKATLASLSANQSYNQAKSKEEKAIAALEITTKSDKATQDFVDGRGEAFNTRLSSLYSDITNGAVDASEGVIQMQQLVSAFRTEVDNSGTESKELANTLLKPYEDMAKVYQDMANGTLDSTRGENQVKSILAKTKLVILADPKNAHAIAVSNLTGNTVAGLLPMNTATTNMFAMSLTKGTTGSGKTPIFVGVPEGDSYIDVIKKSTKVLKDDGSTEDSLPAITEVGQHVGQILKSIDVYQTAVERPEEYNKVVDFIASPEYASVVNAGLVDDTAAQNAKMVLQRDYAEVLMPLVRDKMKKTFATHVGILAGFRDTELNVEDTIDIEVTAGGVVFSPKAGVPMEGPQRVQHFRMVKELNKSVGKQMNKLIRMNAHLDGSTDYKAYGEASLATLLGNQVEGTEEPKK